MPKFKYPVMPITLILGPVKAGKSARLIREINEAKGNSIIVRSSVDNISDIHSRDKKVALKTVGVEYSDEIKDSDNIFIDEGHFITDLAKKIITYRDRNVVIGALNADYKGKIFGAISDIIPICDRIIVLRALCDGCGGTATHSAKISREKENGSGFIVGTDGNFAPMCLKCFEAQELAQSSRW